jgi:hypothetical protein
MENVLLLAEACSETGMGCSWTILSCCRSPTRQENFF